MQQQNRNTGMILEKLELLRKMIVAQLEFDKQHMTRPECHLRLKSKIHRDNLGFLNTTITVVDRNVKLISDETWKEINGLYQTYIRFGKETGSMKEVKHHVIRKDSELPDIEFDPKIFGG